MQPSAQSDDVRLILADGKRVMADGRVLSTITVPQPAAQTSREISSGRAAASALERIHRKLGDLPDIPAKMNPVAAVLTYTAIGLNNADIATALGATEEQIEILKASDIYKQLFELFDKTVFEDAQRNARHIIAKASDRAADTMVKLLDSNDESIQAVASRELMKAAGVSLEEDHKKLAGGLKIVIEKAGSRKDENITIRVGE